jgi:poly(A) polymerase
MSSDLEPKHSYRDAGIKVIRVLREHGHVAYFAGGCVRDMLLGKQPKDYDVATDAHPAKVVSIFHSSRYVGEAFGVSLVRLMGHEIQVATFRSESDYTDGRHPGKVVFTDAKQDALRRDFTINGMFEDPLALTDDTRIIDYVAGRIDLKNRIVRAIGNPDDRFGEDYLRMLRAVRFASRLGFQIETITARAIRSHARFLSQISRERIGQELQLILTGEGRPAGALLLQDLGLDGPVLKQDHQDGPLPTLAALETQTAYPVSLAAWIIDRKCLPKTAPPHMAGRSRSIDHTKTHPDTLVLTGNLERFVNGGSDGLGRMQETLRDALAMSNDQTDGFVGALATLARLFSWDSLGIAEKKRLLVHPHITGGLCLARALRHVTGVSDLVDRIDSQVHGLMAENLRPEPLLRGQDLIEAGVRPSPVFKQILEQAYDLQLTGELSTRGQALTWLNQRVRRETS